MNLKTGERIRHLRIKSNITQEKLANHLGVSVQAVSRWESGSCYPDLELIPAIAIYFGVTTDHLLCVEDETIKPIEEKYKEEWTKAFKNAEHQKAFNIVNEALLSMPDNYDFMLMKVTSLSVILEQFCGSNSLREAERIINSIKEIIDIILFDCDDEKIRCEALSWLIKLEARVSDENALMRIANKMPKVVHTRNALLFRHSLTENEKAEYAREHLLELLLEFIYCAKKLSENSLIQDNEKKDILEGILKILDICAKGNNFGEFEFILDDIFETLFTLTGEIKYKDEIGTHSKIYESLPERYTYDSVFLKNRIFDHKNSIHSSDGSLK